MWSSPSTLLIMLLCHNPVDMDQTASTRSRARYWCFTVNNYNESNIWSVLPAGADYAILGREVATTGTRHIQGFISFGQRKRFTQVSRIVPGAHLTVARNVQASIEYCKKEGDFVELGAPPTLSSSGVTARRGELVLAQQAIYDGLRDRKEIRKRFPNVAARYPRFIDSLIADSVEPPVVTSHPLRDWQASLLETLSARPSDREILFFVDEEGGKGKTWFGSYLAKEKGALVLLAGKKSDLTYVLSKSLPIPDIIVFDVSKCKLEHLHYDLLEEVKNGYVFSPKYESQMIRFPTPHVIVFCNAYPEMDKLSEDRYNVTCL